MSVLLTLFFVLTQVGLFSVGGGYAVIPLIQSQVVNIHRLMTMEEFVGLVTIVEMIPGPILINPSTFVGMRPVGPMGATLCILGCIIPSLIICLALAHFCYKYRGLSGIQAVLAFLRPAVTALIGSVGASILMLVLFNSDIFSVLLANTHWTELAPLPGYLFILRKWKASAVPIIFGSGLVGTLAYLVL